MVTMSLCVDVCVFMSGHGTRCQCVRCCTFLFARVCLKLEERVGISYGERLKDNLSDSLGPHQCQTSVMQHRAYDVHGGDTLDAHAVARKRERARTQTTGNQSHKHVQRTRSQAREARGNGPDRQNKNKQTSNKQIKT